MIKNRVVIGTFMTYALSWQQRCNTLCKQASGGTTNNAGRKHMTATPISDILIGLEL